MRNGQQFREQKRLERGKEWGGKKKRGVEVVKSHRGPKGKQFTFGKKVVRKGRREEQKHWGRSGDPGSGRRE